MSWMAPPGRQSDLEAAVSVLDPPQGVAVLTGEPGAGKTELAATWRAAAATKGYLCGASSLSGMPGDHPLDVLFGAVLDAVSGYEGRGEIEGAWRTIPGPQGVEFPRVRRYLADAAEVDRKAMGFPWESAQLDRLRAVEAAVALVRAVARTRPLALCLQGVHWGSPMLFEYLEHLLALSAEVPFALMLTMQQGMEPPDLLPMLEAATRRAGSRLVQVNLEPLSEISLEEVLASRYPGNAFSELFRRKLCTVADGNPGRLGEMCRRLEEVGVLRQEGGAWLADDERPWPFPDTAEEYRLSSILELATEDFDLLEFLAGTGGPIPDAAVAHPELFRYLGIAERSARKAIGRMVEVGVLEPVPGGWRFRDQALVRALREEADAPLRSRDLSALGGILGDLDAVDPERAARLFEDANEDLRAVAALRESAEHLEGIGAWSSAARAYRRARRLASGAGLEESLEETVDLQRAEGNAWQIAGAPREAAEAYGAALAAAERLGLQGKIAGLRCRRGCARLDLEDPASAESDFEAALEAADAVGSLAARRLALLGIMRARLSRGDPAAALVARGTAGDAADAVAPWLGLEEARARQRAGELEAAERLFLTLAESRSDQPVLASRILSNLARLYLEQEQLEEARRSAQAARARARELGDPEGAVESLEVAGRIADRAGDAEGSLLAWGELFELAGRCGAVGTQVEAGLHAGRRCIERQEMEAAAHFLSRAVSLAQARGVAHRVIEGQNLLGHVNLSLNKLYEAQADFEEAGRRARELLEQEGLAESLLGLGRVYAKQRKRERARETLARAKDAFEGLGRAARAAEAGRALAELEG